MKHPQVPTTARTYRMGRRRLKADRTRAKILAAVRSILTTRSGLATFGLESVARRAGVTRLTVYHQFGSRAGLLEAVYDELARRGDLAERLAASFQLSDPIASLNAAVVAFVGFWSAERAVIRRLRSMAVLDPSFKGVTDRDVRRLAAMRTALFRLADARNRTVSNPDEGAGVLAMLTSFETFESLSRSGSELDKIITTIQELAKTVAENSLR